MKKLSRKNLDELAKVMPVLSETEQRMFVGGTVYCDLSGNYLGKVGAGDDLKFIAQSDFNYYRDNHIEGMGDSFSELSRAAQTTFVMNHSSFKYGQIAISNNSDRDLAAEVLEGGVKIYKYDSVWNNYHDALSTLEHEWYHFDNKHYITTGTIVDVQEEIETYIAQINSAGFANTSYEYKKRVAENMYYIYTRNGINVSLNDLYRMVGIL